MPSLYLPIKPPGQNRETILYIPGASHMDRSQLQEIIASQTEKIHAEAKQRGAPKRRYSKKEVTGALRDFQARLERKRNGTGNPRYF